MPRLLMLAFMLTTVLVPTILLNKILFIILLGWTFILIVNKNLTKIKLVFPSLALIFIFAYGLVLSLPRDNDHALAMQFFFAVLIVFLIHFADHYKLDLDGLSEKCGKSIVGLTFIYWFLVVNSDLNYAGELAVWISEVSASSNSEREFFSDTTFTLGIGSVPFVFVAWCLVVLRVIKKPKLMDVVWLCLYGVIVLISGRRGLVVVSLVFLAVVLVWFHKSYARLIILFGFILLLIYTIPILIDSTNIFSKDEISNDVKIGHLKSYFDSLDIFGAFFGNGLGGFYYSSGSGGMKQHTELTPIDLCRYFGIPLATVFYVLLLIPVRALPTLSSERFIFGFSFFYI